MKSLCDEIRLCREQVGFNFIAKQISSERSEDFIALCAISLKSIEIHGIIPAKAGIIPTYHHFPPRRCREPENMATLYHSLSLHGIIRIKR